MAETWLNGVNVERLRDTMEALAAAPEQASFAFYVQNDWITGGKNRAEIRTFLAGGEEQGIDERFFVQRADEPVALLGQDSAPNPVEHLLVALATCMTTTLAYHAAGHGIRIDDIDVALEGELDLRGFLGIAPEVRPGFSHIDAHFVVATDASAEELQALVKHSPVYDMVSRGTPVNVHFDCRPRLRLHPHDDEDLSQAWRTGDSAAQLAAGDWANRDPAEGPVVDYEPWIPAPDFNESVPGAPEPPG